MLLVLTQKGIERRPTRDVRGRWGRQIHPAWQFDCNSGCMLLIHIQELYKEDQLESFEAVGDDKSIQRGNLVAVKAVYFC